MGALLVGAAAVTALASYGIVRVTSRSPAPPIPIAVAAAPVAIDLDLAGPNVAAPLDLRPPAALPDLTPPTPTPLEAVTATRHAGGRTAETLPPEAIAELADAESALEGGDTAAAIRIARHSLYAAKSGRAFAIMTRAYCKAGDLGNAKSSFHSVIGGERASVARYCKSAGTEIE